MLNAKLLSLATSGALALSAAGAWAQESVGKPEPGGMALQPAATIVARDVHTFDNILHVIATAIVILVCALLLIVMFRFNAKRNPNPARFTHNSLLEVVWTGVPVVILIFIAILSLPRLFEELNVPDPDLVVKVTGNQWNWSYDYPDEEVSFDSFVLDRDELADYGYSEDEYLLAADNPMVVPVGAVVQVLVTGSDVIHSWAVPSFGVKIDAVPGRMNETWFRADKEGMYFGQCSELCGKDHAFMPIVVKVVSEADYKAWLDETREAMNEGGAATKVAALSE